MLVRDIKEIQNGRLISKDSERIRYRVFRFHVKTLQREYLNLPLMTKTDADAMIKFKGTSEAPWMYAKEPVIETKDSSADITFRGLPIYIENPKGSVRHWETEEGETGKTKMFYPYGYIKKTEGTDGDEIDCFIGPDKETEDVFIIAHMLDGEYDEDKVMLGFSDDFAARDAFLAHYQDATHLGKITKMTWEDFKQAIKKHRKGTPITDAKLDTDIAQQIESLQYRIESYQMLLRGGTVQKGSVTEGRYRGHIYDLKEQIAELKRQARNK